MAIRQNSWTTIDGLTERDVEQAVFNHYYHMSSRHILLPHVYIFDWESDIMRVTGDGYFWEYEIKISHSDFRAEKRKRRKWECIEQGSGPAQFWYVSPSWVINEKDVPEWSGLAHMTAKNGRWRGEPREVFGLEVVKRPHQFKNTRKLTDDMWKRLFLKMTDKYWRERVSSQRIPHIVTGEAF